jgi:protein-S-isoprenylcysteine O-methyltransferase
MAMGLAFGEYFIEWLIFPGMKSSLWLMVPAIIVVVAGQSIRTVAMYTAGRSFNHLVQVQSTYNSWQRKQALTVHVVD